MRSPDDILLENLRECLRQAQVYVFWGNAGAISLLSIGSLRLSKPIHIPGLFVDVDLQTGQAFALSFYWVALMFMHVPLSTITAITNELIPADPQLVLAAFLYPSLATPRRRFWAPFLLALPGVMSIIWVQPYLSGLGLPR